MAKKATRWELFVHIRPDDIITLNSRAEARAVGNLISRMGFTTTWAPEGWFAREADKWLDKILTPEDDAAADPAAAEE